MFVEFARGRGNGAEASEVNRFAWAWVRGDVCVFPLRRWLSSLPAFIDVLEEAVNGGVVKVSDCFIVDEMVFWGSIAGQFADSSGNSCLFVKSIYVPVRSSSVIG